MAELSTSHACPGFFICPIMQNDQCMSDPVVAADGHTYERSGIERWLQNHNTSPITREELKNQELLSNHQLKSQIAQ